MNMKEQVINFSVHNVPGSFVNKPFHCKDVGSNSQKADTAIAELSALSGFDPDKAVLFLKGTSDFGLAFLLKWILTFGFKGRVAHDCQVNTNIIMLGQLGTFTEIGPKMYFGV